MSSIRTAHCLLRKIVASDIQEVYNGLSNTQVTKHYGISFNSLEATKEQMSWYKNPKQCWWAICSSDNKTFYGAAGLNDISTEYQKAEIGLWLLPRYWGKGIMPEVMPYVCNYGFKELNLHRIEGFVESDNHKCKKAMAKLEFLYEGTMKDCELKNGKFISVDIYARLKSQNHTPNRE